MALWPAPQYVVGSITFPGEDRREAELDKRMRDQARELRELRETQGYIYLDTIRPPRGICEKHGLFSGNYCLACWPHLAIGTNSAEEETETRKALDRVLDPKTRITPKDCDRLIDKATSSKKEHEAFTNILGRKP